MYAKALVLRQGETTVVLITVDAVAIGEIGYVGNDYMENVRGELAQRYQIPPECVLANASHCHGIVRRDADRLSVQAVEQALKNLVPVRIGVGTGTEDRVSENRRLKLKDGREADVRHAYALVPDSQVVGTGPIDPEIGILKLDRLDGSPFAVVYNFACHPIQGVPGGTNTADMTGIASQVIEDALGHGAVAFFIQGCAGDINPVYYKAVNFPRDAETLGTLLASRVLKGVAQIQTKAAGPLKVLRRILVLPRADYARRIAALEKRRSRLVESLQGTSLNLKTFMELSVKQGLWSEFPSYYSYSYLHQKQLGREQLKALDAENRRNLERYLRNIYIMEELTRINTNLRLLKKHHAEVQKTGKKTLDVEVAALRVGDFYLITFPGELTVEIGLNLKKRSPHPFTFVAGYTNGYIYYAPTARQLANQGGAQEDSDTLLAPQWQQLFETRALELLRLLP
ncbi:MAG TPA: hypothetical protein ENJ50_02190 [Planctomycetaceae bacterium]|nr:hypothetical protein [Planctomycetaceae bacterium]